MYQARKLLKTASVQTEPETHNSNHLKSTSKTQIPSEWPYQECEDCSKFLIENERLREMLDQKTRGGITAELMKELKQEQKINSELQEWIKEFTKSSRASSKPDTDSIKVDSGIDWTDEF